MPLCTGVRPWIEDVPNKEVDARVELYTSNTTAPILSIMNRVSAEPAVPRLDLENSLMRNKVLTAFGRKQLLDGVYGREPDPKDYRDVRTGFTGKHADKDRFFRYHLGNKVVRGWVPGKRVRKGAGLHWENEGVKSAYEYADVEDEDGDAKFGQGPATRKEVTPAWMSQELRRVGGFDPLAPDKRGVWKMAAKPLPGIELLDPDSAGVPAQKHLRTGSAGGGLGESGKGRETADGDGKKRVRIDQLIMDLKILPHKALVVVKEVLRVMLETTPFRVDRFQLSLSELVGLGRCHETFHVPQHTDHEQQYVGALRDLCAQHLDLLLKSQTLTDFEGLISLANWRKEYFMLMDRVMQSMPEWQLRTMHIYWTLNRKLLMLRGELDTKARGSQALKSMQPHLSDGQSMRTNSEYLELEQRVRKNKLDEEWYDRIIVMQTRDRRYLCAELQLQVEQAILPKKTDTAALADSHQHSLRQLGVSQASSPRVNDEVSPKRSIKKPSSAQHLTPKRPSTANAVMARKSAPPERQPRPLDGVTPHELADTPRYWFDDRLASSDERAFVDELNLHQVKALKDMIRDSEEFLFPHGPKGDQVITSKMLAYKTLHRKRGNGTAQNELSFTQMCQQQAGVVPGRVVEDAEVLGATRGACAFRLIPSFEQHDKQFLEIQKVLQKPCVDAKGKALRLAAPANGINRPPTATPKAKSFQRALRLHTRKQNHPREVRRSHDGTVSLTGGEAGGATSVPGGTVSIPDSEANYGSDTSAPCESKSVQSPQRPGQLSESDSSVLSDNDCKD